MAEWPGSQSGMWQASRELQLPAYFPAGFIYPASPLRADVIAGEPGG
jgi:hypothetical protein